MEIKYLETVEEAVNAIKLYTKPRKIGFIICTIYILIVALYLIIIGDEKLIGYFFIFFTIILGVTNIIKTKKAINNFKRKYEYSYNNEVERNIKIEDDKMIYFNNKTQAITSIEYKIIKKVKINKDYIFINTIFKEWIYIVKDKITKEEYNFIINKLKINKVEVK